MRRKRRARVVWLPPDPYKRVGQGETTITSSDQCAIGEYTILPPGGQGNYGGAVIPLIGDRPGTENLIIGGTGTGLGGSNPATFSDLYNSGYRLRRICGHIFTACDQEDFQDPTVNNNFLVTAALQVMEADRGAALDAAEGAPDIYQTVDNPWIWRRTWMLTNYVNALAATKQTWGVVSNVQGAASLREGSFMDQKTIRKVGPDHRLFLCLQVTNIDGEANGLARIRFWWNLRVLGSLMTNLGNRGNSSR